MKRIICFLLVLMLAALAGCSEKTESSSKAPETEAATLAAYDFTPDPKSEYEYETREIWCENNGNRIFGEAYIPKTDGAARFPLIIHAHGMGSHHKAGAAYLYNSPVLGGVCGVNALNIKGAPRF